MISFRDVSCSYGDTPAVEGVSFDVPAGETCVLLGPSGCGKTTLMRTVNRLVRKTSGRILVGGEDIDGLDPVQLRRRIGYVIQDVGLFPTMTVEENIRVVPDLLGWSRPKGRDRAAELLTLLGLDTALLGRYPDALSGGQAQRVGVARALAADPPVLLMDEPFGAVDPVNRSAIQAEFLVLQKRLGKTVLFVSHDIDEALLLGTRIAVMRDGRLVQCDRPAAILARPADPFVGAFLGENRVLRRLGLMRVADILATDGPAATLRPGDDLGQATALMERLGQSDLVVLDDAGRASALLCLEAAREAREGSLVADAMVPLEEPLRPEDDLRAAAALLLARGRTALPCIADGGRLAGYVTPRRIGRALDRAGDGAPLPPSTAPS